MVRSGAPQARRLNVGNLGPQPFPDERRLVHLHEELGSGEGLQNGINRLDVDAGPSGKPTDRDALAGFELNQDAAG
jgi:hypothetical protein